MPWVRFDDTFTINRKVDGLSNAAFRLHVSAIFWCARNLTDGFVPKTELGLVSARIRSTTRLTSELVHRGLWIPKPSMDGWEIKDYLDYQPAKEKVLEQRELAAERQRKWREAKRGNSSSNGASHSVTNGGSNAGSNPSPPRPAPSLKGGGGGERASPSARSAAPNSPPSSPWCGSCDQNTRLVDVDDTTLARCPNCHPSRSDP